MLLFFLVSNNKTQKIVGSNNFSAQFIKIISHDALVVCRAYRVYLLDFFCSGIQFYLLLSPYLCLFSLLYLDLYVLGDDAFIS